MRAGPCQLCRPARDRPVERHLQLFGTDPHAVEIERRPAAGRNAATHSDRRSRQIGERCIGHRRDARIEVRAELPPAGIELEVGHGGTACPPDIVEHQPVRPHGTAQLVAPGIQIAAQGKIGSEAAEGDAQVIGNQPVT